MEPPAAGVPATTPRGGRRPKGHEVAHCVAHGSGRALAGARTSNAALPPHFRASPPPCAARLAAIMEAVSSAGQYFVTIGLVTYVPYQLVIRGIKHIV